MSVERSDDKSLVEIKTRREISALAFSADGEHLFIADTGGIISVWHIQNRRQITKIEKRVSSLVVSKDSKYLAGGALDDVSVWDIKTYENVNTLKHGYYFGVDFSPDSSRLVGTEFGTRADVWDIATGEKVLSLEGGETMIIAAKYSPKGDRIATASGRRSVRVWDSNDGNLLIDIAEVETGYMCGGLFWLQDHVLVVFSKEAKAFDTSTGLCILEWPVDGVTRSCRVAMSQHRRFIVHSSDDGAITFWDPSSHRQFAHVWKGMGHDKIAISPDSRFLASADSEEGRGNIVIYDIGANSSLSHPTLQEVDTGIDKKALNFWKKGQLSHAKASLTAQITMPDTVNHRALACRALIRSRLGERDAAIVDAEKSVGAQRSVIGYIAKYVALAGEGDNDDQAQAYDIAFEYFHSTHMTTLILVKAVVLCMDKKYDRAISRMNNLIDAVYFNSSLYVTQAYMYLLKANACMGDGEYALAIESFECARTRLGSRKTEPILIVSLISGWKFDRLGIVIRQSLCETMCAAGRINEASQVVLETIDTFTEEEIKPDLESIIDLLQRCLSAPKSDEDIIRTIDPNEDSQLQHLAVGHPFLTPLLKEWARLMLSSSTWKNALDIAASFSCSRRVVYQALCERLVTVHRAVDAVACFHQMNFELERGVYDIQAMWVLEFQSRCVIEFNELGNAAMNACRHDDAASHYTLALSLSPASIDLLSRRSKAYISCSMWEEVLNDANQMIELNPSSLFGYQRKLTALHGAGRDEDATAVFETMLEKMSESSDPIFHRDPRKCIPPAQIKETIRNVVQRIVRETPLVLINTKSGRLLDKSAQATSFESQPIFYELISSITTDIDHATIEHEVAQYYQYVMFSHRWEDNEPLYDEVVNIVVYDLEDSKTHKKLKTFCKVAREDGFNWAWSDTCCIDKRDHFVLQEALVSMFKWYQGAAMTIVYLLGVHRSSETGSLAKSVWNTRAWTLQEYHASKVVRFYTEDWTPYLNLAVRNHKDSPEVISEMEMVTGVSTRTLMSLRSGLDDIREKLQLAAPRQTTRIEDAAYSLLGIFSISLPVVYGEGDKALGRLLAQILTSSGDTSILAWSGRSGSFNSCLPDSLTVFKMPEVSHIPSIMTDVTVDLVDLGNMKPITDLYDRLNDLSVPLFVGQRMKLPCVSFKLGQTSEIWNGPERVFRAQTSALGVVEIQTGEDLSRMGTLYLVHPWIDFLLDRHPVGDGTNVMKTIVEEESTNMDDTSSVLGELPSLPGLSNAISRTQRSRAAWIASRLGLPFGGQRIITPAQDPSGLRPPSTIAPTEKQARALGLLSRLRQPFGALLLTPTRRHVEEYRRIASDCLITVRVEEITPEIVDTLTRNVRVLDVL